MKKLFLSIIFAFTAFMLNAQEIKTTTWNGVERRYLEYVPATYDAATPSPVLFCLHGLGQDCQAIFDQSRFYEIAEEKGWILVYPEALDYSIEIPLVGSYDFGNAWAAGVTITVSFTIYGVPISYDFTLNGTVDDSGFLNALIDEMENNYNIEADSVFFAGISLGGFMCHRMAIEHGERINGIASVSGLVGTDMKDLTPAANVNVLEVFGTADENIDYENATVERMGMGPFVVGLPAEQTTEYWRSFNNCDEMPVFEQYPDTQNDSLTFEMYSYQNGDNDSRVSFLKVINGEHAWYSGGNYDVDYETEIYRFFTNTIDVTDVKENAFDAMNVYPNPANDFIYIGLDEPSEIHVFDLLGNEVLHTIANGKVDVSSLTNGIYFLKVDEKIVKFLVNR